MLRLISVSGIVIAMVVGFIAISTQMQDDFSVRSRVIDVLRHMKTIANDELQCATTTNAPAEVRPNQETDAESSEIEQPPESQTLADEPDLLTDSEPLNTNADIIKTMGYRIIQSKNAATVRAEEKVKVEVVAVFNDVNGDSGKLRIKSGSRVVIQCDCVAQALSCKTVESNINKNYLPKNLTKKIAKQ